MSSFFIQHSSKYIKQCTHGTLLWKRKTFTQSVCGHCCMAVCKGVFLFDSIWKPWCKTPSWLSYCAFIPACHTPVIWWWRTTIVAFSVPPAAAAGSVLAHFQPLINPSRPLSGLRDAAVVMMLTGSLAGCQKPISGMSGISQKTCSTAQN